MSQNHDEHLNTPWMENPFYILGLATTCSAAEIERQGQKLLSMLSVGLSSAAFYATPLGKRPCTQELVRQAMAELRDPERRLGYELWAQLDPQALPVEQTESHDTSLQWPAAFSAFGFTSYPKE